MVPIERVHQVGDSFRGDREERVLRRREDNLRYVKKSINIDTHIQSPDDSPFIEFIVHYLRVYLFN